MNRFSRLLKRILNGDFSQGQAFWLMLVPALLLVKTVTALLSLSNVIANPVLSARLWLPILIITILFVLPVLFFGCLRAIFIAKQQFQGGYQSVCLFLATLFLLYLTVSHVQQRIPLLTTMANIAASHDNMTLSLTADRSTLTLNGQLAYGSTKKVKQWLAKNPDTKQVSLNIDAGHLHEARALARVIIQHKLNTRVDTRCAASCMLVLVAGIERTASAGALLQFHRTLDYDNGYRSDWMIERERAADRAYYLRRAVDSGYVFPIYYPQKNDDYLSPELAILVNAGVITTID